MKNRTLYLLGTLLVPLTVSCSDATTTTTVPADGDVGTAQEALVPTTYRFQLDSIQFTDTSNADNTFYPDTGTRINSLINEPIGPVFAGLGVQVGSDNPAAVSCTLGKWDGASRSFVVAPASGGNTLQNCAGGLFTAGQQLGYRFTLNAPTDQVTLGVALDSLYKPPNSGTSAGNAWISAVLGIAGAFVGAVATVATEGTALALAGVGAAASSAGVVVGATSGIGTAIDCSGGLIARDIHGKPTSDALYFSFDGKRLFDITAGGPATISIPISLPGYFYDIITSDGYEELSGTSCHAAFTLNLSITRDWTTGPAAFPKSSDAAVVRPGQQEVDVYAGDATGGMALKSWDSSTGWTTLHLPITGLSFPPTSAMPFEQADGTSFDGRMEAFFVNGNGQLTGSEGGGGKVGGQSIFAVPTAPKLSTAAHIAATTRAPNYRDLFYIGSDGGIWTTVTNILGTTSFELAKPGSNFPGAPPGAPIAAVSRNSNQLDLFVVGNDGALYTGYWYNGAVSWGIYAVSSRISYPGASVTAVSRSSSFLDVFFHGNDGKLYQSTWFSGAPVYNTVAIPNAPAAGTIRQVSAVARNSDNANYAEHMDVAYVSSDNRVVVADWAGDAGWTWQYVTGPTAHGLLSIVARSEFNLDVFYRDQNNNVATATWAYGGSSSWASFVLP